MRAREACTDFSTPTLHIHVEASFGTSTLLRPVRSTQPTTHKRPTPPCVSLHGGVKKWFSAMHQCVHDGFSCPGLALTAPPHTRQRRPTRGKRAPPQHGGARAQALLEPRDAGVHCACGAARASTPAGAPPGCVSRRHPPQRSFTAPHSTHSHVRAREACTNFSTPTLRGSINLLDAQQF